VSEDGAVGAVIGIGIGAAFLLLLTRRAHAMSTGSPRARESSYTFPPYLPILGGPYASRLNSLLARGTQGERWRTIFARNAPPGYADPDWIDAIVRWTGIESGGNPTDVTGGKELGLLQINRAATELGFTSDELNRYVAKSTSDDDRARTSWRYVQKLALPMAGVATPDAKAHAWLTYMRHALPLVLHELAVQGFLSDGPASEKMNAAWEAYRPSDRARIYATTKIGTPGQQLLLRFVAAADAVAGYDRSARWTMASMAA
jgi:hypothetical protein